MARDLEETAKQVCSGTLVALSTPHVEKSLGLSLFREPVPLPVTEVNSSMGCSEGRTLFLNHRQDLHRSRSLFQGEAPRRSYFLPVRQLWLHLQPPQRPR